VSLYVRIKRKTGLFNLDVEFEVSGGVTGLLGASGCGKSMTLRCVAGVMRPDEGLIVSNGRVLFDSKRRVNLSPQRRNVGLLFQSCAMFPNMTVAGCISAVLRAGAKGQRRYPGDLGSLIRQFRLDGLENHYPENLSGGERQRAAMACIMASGPEVKMLDEPLSALDSYLRWQLEGELAQIADDFGGVTLYVSHNRDEVYRMCDRVCVMRDGRSEGVRTVDELFESPDTYASSLLSGCKNYSRAEKISERRVRAVDWGVELECGRTIPDDAAYIGVRSHYARVSRDASGVNVFRCRVIRVTRDVFGTIVSVVPSGASSDCGFSRVRMEMTRDEAEGLSAGDEIFARIKPDDVMPLRE
jgi:molybdate transport system ATP-binding protein